VTFAAAVAMFAFGAPLAQGRSTDNLTIDVTITATGQVSATLPDGTPLGVPTGGGAPPVIPAGFYTILLSSPGGCGAYPYFNLTGQGVSISTNLDGGEETNMSLDTSFQPNSTYTWSSSAGGGTYTFATNGTIEGTAPVLVTSGSASTISSVHSTASSSDLVGSAATTSSSSHRSAARAVLGVLTGSLGSSDRVVLREGGLAVHRLKPGRYTITVKVSRHNSSLALRLGSHTPLAIATSGSTGTTSRTVDLTAGRWEILLGSSSKIAGSLTVS
jgi:hypothetical protein